MSHTIYLELEHDVSNHGLLQRWVSKDAPNMNANDIHILVLGSLRKIDQAWTFDDIGEATVILRECYLQFLVFI